MIFYRGPSFRKAFHKLGALKSLTKAPIMALSASAPPSFEMDIFSTLALSDPVLVKMPLNRSNIFLSVGKKSSIKVSLVF